MKIDVFATNSGPHASVAHQFTDWRTGHGGRPDFIAVHQSVASRSGGIEDQLTDVSALHGATSCLGVMSQDGPFVDAGVGAFAIWDPDGDFGTGMQDLGSNSRAAARLATEEALTAADRSGEAPDVIWLSCSPGSEEEVLAGIEDVVGGNVPILGGSAADDTVEGHWQVFDAQSTISNGVIVSVLFPSKPISFAYHNGYAPTVNKGVVTKANGRILHEIDGQPAADVYRSWATEGLIPSQVDERTAILSESTLSPLGRYLEEVGGVPFYLLFHPAGLLPDGSLELFADVQVGDELTLMMGAPDQLAERAGKVAALAAQSAAMPTEGIAGALMVYCGGCMLAVKDRLTEVSDGINRALPKVPFMGVFTFGEQGMVVGERNRHGNLMISAIVFAS
ncbi:MAG: FIST N-terminal domain-containing protein [Pseudomonadota bacterium]